MSKNGNKPCQHGKWKKKNRTSGEIGIESSLFFLPLKYFFLRRHCRWLDDGTNQQIFCASRRNIRSRGFLYRGKQSMDSKFGFKNFYRFMENRFSIGWCELPTTDFCAFFSYIPVRNNYFPLRLSATALAVAASSSSTTAFYSVCNKSRNFSSLSSLADRTVFNVINWISFLLKSKPETKERKYLPICTCFFPARSVQMA